MKKILERLTGPIATGVVVALLLPAAAYAESQLVTIVDGASSEPASVTKGALHIRNEFGKSLAVEGTVTARDHTAGRRPWAHTFSVAVRDADVHDLSIPWTVPEGKRLVVTHVSGTVEWSSEGSRARFVMLSAEPHRAYIETGPPVAVGHAFTQVFTQQVQLEIDAGRDLRLNFRRTAPDGVTICHMFVSGYLLNV